MSGLFLPEIKTRPDAQEHVRAWIAALRSGKYEQGKHMLRGPFGYCYLGVACDLVDSSRWALRTGGVTGSYEWTRELGDPAVTELPEEVFDWLAMRSSTGYLDIESGSLVGLNDTGRPFSEIADVIELELNEVLAGAATS